MREKVLIVGCGGREHALAWKISQSDLVSEVFVAPGNAGSADEAKVTNIDIKHGDITKLLDFARSNNIGLTVVGTEDALEAGIADRFEAQNLPILAPNRAAAKIETSKIYAKEFMQKHHIPTPGSAAFYDVRSAQKYLSTRQAPVVVKEDGLAAGKGVVVAQSMGHARQVIQEKFSSGKNISIEDCVYGSEVSCIAVSDGMQHVFFEEVRDHKSISSEVFSANTGGMGTISPIFLPPQTKKKIHEEIMAKTLQGMREEGRPFVGFLFANIMVQEDGEPTVLEFNARLGDPETQVLLLRMKSDLFALCRAATHGDLASQDPISWSEQHAVGVVMAADGYPGSCRKGDPITIGSPAHKKEDAVKIFHAGTARQENGTLVTNGGRVLCVCGLGEDMHTARKMAYGRCAAVKWCGAFFRDDIGSAGISSY